MKKFLLFLIAACALCQLQARPVRQTVSERKQPVQKRYRYRVTFTDKKDCGFSVKHPEAFLSAKSIARRKRYKLKVDRHDLPITPAYLHRVQQLGLKEFNRSKWNNSAVFETTDTLVLNQVRQLDFVKEVRCVWEGPDSIRIPERQVPRQQRIVNRRDTLKNLYGRAATQVEMLGVDQLHAAGYNGKGVTIAVIDGGFFNADCIPGLKDTRILGTRNFAHPGTSVYEELDHGMMVLSCIGANVPHHLVGTAPEASFYLLVSEDGSSEQLIEEDNWCAALEYADSLGCDMATSSLGYHRYDYSYMSHAYHELDGKTALISRSASLAASRGMCLLNSAGNSGDESWKKISVPADATDMLTVGAVDASRVNSIFSSVGNSADGRVKPDVMAMGVDAWVFENDGTLTKVDGTSFSCPIMCGAVACLIQAFPELRPADLIPVVRQSGNHAEHPNNIFGYGIPDLNKAFKLLKEK